MRTVITYGTFDLFHIGHVNLLKRARELGDRLIVAVSSDEFNQVKGKTTLVPYVHRAEVVASCRYVDKVIAEHNWTQKTGDIKRENVDILVMGHDWQGKFDELKDHCDVVYLPRTEGISSTSLKNALAILKQLQNQLS